MRVAKWNTTDDVYAMLSAARRRASINQLRLFALACCESVNPPPEIRSLPAVVRAVQQVLVGLNYEEAILAAGQLASDECARWVGQHPQHQWALAALRLADPDFDCDVADDSPRVFNLCWHVVLFLRQATSSTEIPFAEAKMFRPFADILRDIVAPVKRPRFLRRWRTEVVKALAHGIQADQAFDRLPILADALEEAGCDNAELLNHCRGPGPHVHGCWALDLVRGWY